MQRSSLKKSPQSSLTSSPREGTRGGGERTIRFRQDTSQRHLAVAPGLVDDTRVAKPGNPFHRDADPEHHIEQLHARRDASDQHVQRVARVLASKRDHMFDGLEREELQLIAKQCKCFKVSEGSLLFCQGDAADCMYVVIRGGFRVAKDFIHSPPVLAKAEELAFMEVGDVVGETGFIKGAKRSAFVQALTNSEVIKITQPILTALKLSRPNLQRHIQDELGKKNKVFEEREKAAYQEQIEDEEKEEEEELLRVINSHLDKMKEYRMTIKTIKRERWRKKFDHATHKVQLLERAWQDNVKLAVEHDSQQETLEEIIRLLAKETTEDPGAWQKLQDFLNLYPECVNMIVPRHDLTLLQIACIRGVPKLVSTLIGHGADPNISNSKRHTALHLVFLGDAKHKAQRSDGSLDNDRLQTLRLLCAHGAMLLRDEDGKTALDLARHEIPCGILKELWHQQLLACADPECCNRDPSILCSRCRLAKYCCGQHADHHWQHHRLVCVPAPGAEDAAELMSSEAHRRFLKTHEVLTLKQKGLDFVVNSQAKWDIEASIFDQERILTSSFHAWLRYVMILRTSLALRFRDIKDQIDSEQDKRRRQIYQAKKKMFAVTSFSSSASPRCPQPDEKKPKETRHVGHHLRPGHAHAAAGEQEGVKRTTGTSGKVVGTVGGGVQRKGRGVTRAGSPKKLSPSKESPSRGATGEGGVHANERKRTGFNEQEKKDIVKGVLEKKLEKDTEETRDAILKQAGLIEGSKSESDQRAFEIITELKKGQLFLEELHLRDLKSVCKYTVPDWDMAIRHRHGFPRLEDRPTHRFSSTQGPKPTSPTALKSPKSSLAATKSPKSPSSQRQTPGSDAGRKVSLSKDGSISARTEADAGTVAEIGIDERNKAEENEKSPDAHAQGTEEEHKAEAQGDSAQDLFVVPKPAVYEPTKEDLIQQRRRVLAKAIGSMQKLKAIAAAAHHH